MWCDFQMWGWWKREYDVVGEGDVRCLSWMNRLEAGAGALSICCCWDSFQLLAFSASSD